MVTKLFASFLPMLSSFSTKQKSYLPPEFFSLFPADQIELAILRFPYDSWGTPFQQLKQVVEEPSPQLPADQFSPDFVDFSSQWWELFFISCCLLIEKAITFICR